MTDTTPAPDSVTADPIRIPIIRSVSYAARGLPGLPYQYGRGTLVPHQITLTYRGAPDSQLGRVHAYVVGRIHVDGQPVPHSEPYGQHYDEGLDGFPEWLAVEARLHDPAAASSAGPAPVTDRASVLDEVADVYDRVIADMGADVSKDPRYWAGVLHVVMGLRHLAGEARNVTVLPAPVDPAAVLNRATEALLTDIGLRETEGEQALAEYGRELVALLRGVADGAQPAFIPPAAEGLPPGALDSATSGASALHAWARDPHTPTAAPAAVAQPDEET